MKLAVYAFAWVCIQPWTVELPALYQDLGSMKSLVFSVPTPRTQFAEASNLVGCGQTLKHDLLTHSLQISRTQNTAHLAPA